jgi:Glycine-rich domain-containing protein-like
MSTQSEEAVSMSLSVALNSRVIDHYVFLKTLHEQGTTSSDNASSAESLRRYLLWLDLLVRENEHGHSTAKLVPPSDIAWFWHCHRLAPEKYEAYIRSMPFKDQNTIVALREPSGDPYRLMENHNETLRVWRKNYPTESFALPQTSSSCSAPTMESLTETLAGFDLIASTRRQAELYWHLQPHFVATDDGCTPTFDPNQALQDYHRFLHLMKVVRGTNTMLVPTYLIDLYWHTHITGARIYDYHTDCERICGCFIDHDDDFAEGERNGGALDQAFLATAKLWKDTYGGVTYGHKGGYRGPPPSDYFTVPVQAEQAPPIAFAGTLPAGDSPTDDDTSTATSEKSHCGGLIRVVVLLCILIGVALRLIGMNLIRTDVEYVCGGISPSRSELEARTTLPLCLNVSVRDEVLCLRSGDPVDQTPVYCQTDVGDIRGDASGNWYLWFSGAAWRMLDNMIVIKGSIYVLRTKGDTELPLGTMSWMVWGRKAGGDWHSDKCDETDRGDDDKYVIPSACFVEKVSVSYLTIVSNLVFGVGFFIAFCWVCGTCAMLSRFAASDRFDFEKPDVRAT